MSNISTSVSGEEQSTAFADSLVDLKAMLLGDDNTTSCIKGNMTPHCTDLTKVAISNIDDHKIATLIWQVCPPILFFFGTTGNMLIILMLRRLRLGNSSMHIYLRVLAITDLIVIYTGLLRWWILWSFDLDIRLVNVFICKIHVWLVYVSLSVSAWLLVLMTLERTLSVCIPHKVRMFCTKRRAWIIIMFIIILHGCIQSHFLIGITIVNRNGHFECDALPGAYGDFVHKTWPLVDLYILSVLPFICLIICNIIIVYKTFCSLKAAAHLNLTSETNSVRRRNASSMTAILLVLSTFFLLTTSPTCVYNMWERGMAAKTMGETPQGVAKLELLWAAVNIFMYCNNSLNFYLYCLTGSKFRREMKRQFSRYTSNRTETRLLFSAQSLHRFNNISQREIKKNGMVVESGKALLPTPTRLSISMRDSNAYL